MSHHLTYYVTSSYILCRIIIHTMSHHHTYYVASPYILCHIIIHTMSHHHTYYVTSSYILCHITMHTTPSSIRLRLIKASNWCSFPPRGKVKGSFLGDLCTKRKAYASFVVEKGSGKLQSEAFISLKLSPGKVKNEGTGTVCLAARRSWCQLCRQM